MVLKGWKEKQSPGRVKADESPDGKGVILIWTASEDPAVEKNVERFGPMRGQQQDPAGEE